MNEKTVGSLFAGIGGFDKGFEDAGWKTRWQVEIDETKRAVLTDRFPNAKRFKDVRECGQKNLSQVDCITAGFPCQDISQSGSRRKDKDKSGLKGDKSSLFFEAIRIVKEIQPSWIVFENVPSLLHSNDHTDFETVVKAFAECGYLGYWRVLDAQYFGSPQRRRRIFLVGGFGKYPSIQFLVNATPMEGLPSSFGPREESWCAADDWPGYTLQATNTASRITLGGELLIAEENGWSQMVKRARTTQDNGLCFGLDEANLAEAHGAGNAVYPKITQWIAGILAES